MSWEDGTLSATQTTYFHLSFFGSEVAAYVINVHYQASTKIESIMLSQEAPAFERLSQRVMTNLSPCVNKKREESGA